MRKTILDSYYRRFACKVFDSNRKISDEDFNLIMEAGRLSPSSFGFEPWRFLVINSSELREKIRKFSWGAQTQLPTASHFIIILNRKPVDMKAFSNYTEMIMKEVQRLPKDIIETKSEFFSKFQANDFKLSDDKSLTDWSSKQTYIALANIMTTASLIGIDSCPIEGFDKEKIDELLSLEGVMDPEHFSSSVMVALGYRDDSNRQPMKTRQDYNEIVKIID